MNQPQFQLPGNKPLWEQVHDALEQMIVHRQLAPGQRLHERDLSDRFGVSRGPIREALLALQKDGWVDARHHQGTFVHKPSGEEARQLFEMRRILESQAAALAAQRAGEGDIVQLNTIVEAGFRALSDQDVQASITLNTRFHRAIHGSTNNQVLADLMVQLEKKVTWFLSAVMAFRGQASWPEHRGVLQAIEAGDPDRAAELMAQHTNATYEAYLQTLAEGGSEAA